MKCPYCSAAAPPQGRCTTASTGRSITECTSCGRVIEERQTQTHHMFHLRAQDSPLFLSTSDLPNSPRPDDPDSDPFDHTGFITAFSTWSLEQCSLFALSSLSFSGHLAELERALDSSNSGTASGNSGTGNPSGVVVVDNLRAYLQIVDVASILGLDHDISDHAFQLFRDCSSATCLRNRSVEALATACLVQAIREAQEPRTLQEISIAANLPQKEIGKYIKILGEALQLSQPINSNSIAVHMPRFCNLLQLNKSAQELATHIGEVVMNKCFCTRRNPISISAAAIYLACQLEDRRKTQAEICKVTGLTEVTLRKVYKELLENWDDLLPSNYTPVVPPEKAFPTTTIASGRSTASRVELPELTTSDREKQPEIKHPKMNQVSEFSHQDKGKGETEGKGGVGISNKAPSWKSSIPCYNNTIRTSRENQKMSNSITMEADSTASRAELPELTPSDREKQPEIKKPKINQVSEMSHQDRGKGETESKGGAGISNMAPLLISALPCYTKTSRENHNSQGFSFKTSLHSSSQEADSTAPRAELPELTILDQEKQPDAKQKKTIQVSEMSHHQDRSKGEAEGKSGATISNNAPSFISALPYYTTVRTSRENQNDSQGIGLKKPNSGSQEAEQNVIGSMRPNPFVASRVLGVNSVVRPPRASSPSSYAHFSQPGQNQATAGSLELKESAKHNEHKRSDPADVSSSRHL